MIVAGGTYREEVVTLNHHEDLGGSGFRAAAALPASSTTLVTAVESELVSLLVGGAKLYGFAIQNSGRSKPVGFEYFAPFTQPTIRGIGAVLASDQDVHGEQVLAFGLIESGVRNFSVDQLVYDPQTVSDPELAMIAGLDVRSRVISANAAEIMAVGGASKLEESARAARERLNADAIITKAGARGCLVTDGQRQEWVGALPTRTVWKLGSGDIFSAGFAHAYFRGADPIEAARVASVSAAWWCSTRNNQIPAAILAGERMDVPESSHELTNSGRQARIYLAGPFFTTAERWLVEVCRTFLTEAGASVFSPVHDVGLGGQEVAAADLAGLEQADAILALLDGWDAGTLFECGWAHHAGTPTVAVASDLGHVGATMLLGTGAELHTDVTTALYRSIWVALGAPILGALK